MLNTHEKNLASELLKIVSWLDLQSLTRTVTDGIVLPMNIDEACAVILQHSKSFEELLSRQKITKEILFTYLHNKKVACIQRDKPSLKTMVINLWREVEHNQPEIALNCSGQQLLNSVSHPYYDKNTSRPQNLTVANELAHKFTEWFYTLINQSKPQLGECPLGPEHFFPNCSVRINLLTSNDSLEKKIENDAAGVVRALIDTKTEHNLYFNPNLSSEGVQGKMDQHGLVMVAVCGTLHQNEKCAGVFEQLFGLARDPFSSNNWKVKYTELNLMSQDCVTGLPSLKDSELGRTLLAITEVE